MNGFVKIDRQMLEWEWYSDLPTKATFLHLLLIANFKDGRFLGKEIKRGECVIGLNATAEAIGISVKQLRTALMKLEETGSIKRRTNHHFTIVTIINYEKIQGDERANKKQGATHCNSNDCKGAALVEGQTKGKQRANKGQTKGKQRATSEERKESKERKKGRISPWTPSHYPAEIEEAINNYREMLIRINKPMSDDELPLLLSELYRLSGGLPERAEASLNQSTLARWRGVFPVKGPVPDKPDPAKAERARQEQLEREARLDAEHEERMLRWREQNPDVTPEEMKKQIEEKLGVKLWN